MQIPPSWRTSWAGWLGAVLGGIALIPGLPAWARSIAEVLSPFLLGGGLVVAADARAMAKATRDAAQRVCPACGGSMCAEKEENRSG